MSSVSSINPLRIDVDGFCQIYNNGMSEGWPTTRARDDVRLTLLWYRWSQTLHTSNATPSFLSTRTFTELSWWQKRHVNVVSIGVKEFSNNLQVSPQNIPTKGLLPPGTCWFARRLFSLSHPCVRQLLRVVGLGVDVRVNT